MSALDDKLLDEVRGREEKAHKRVVVLSALLDEAQTEHQQLKEARINLEGITKEQDDFTRAASDLLGNNQDN